MEKINVKNNINKYYIAIGSLCIIAVAILLLGSISENTKQYLVQNGELEHTEIATGFVIKKEHVIEKDESKVLVPVIAEGSRISKADVIATYKGEEYQNYEETLAQMDKEILERMKELPIVYSSEVDAIETNIYMLLKESIGETSYSKMQEYKQKINSNINKRANIIGELSPAGAEIKRLIQERNSYEQEAKKSNDNIIATMPGIVCYKVDGLEEKLNYTDIQSLDYTSIKETIKSSRQENNTKIKIVNNYEAYVVMKVKLENEKYIAEGYNYRLRLIEQDGYELLGRLERVNIVDEGVEVYFKITNGIEHIANLREVEIEVVWDSASGCILPYVALNKLETQDVYYVTVIKYAEYVNIPVAIKVNNENYVVVKNYETEELEQLGLESKYKLELYDRVVIETKK